MRKDIQARPVDYSRPVEYGPGITPVSGTIAVIRAAADERLLYDRRTAARMLSISIRSLAYLLSRGEIRFRRIGSKTLIPRAELLRFARGHHPSPLARVDEALQG